MSLLSLFLIVHRDGERTFPTRRSSDLAWAPHRTKFAATRRNFQIDETNRLYVFQEHHDCRVLPRSVPRSEEHTSELQSRGHLVCRPLVEKKKYILSS